SRPRLAPESLQHLRIARRLFRQEFQRNTATQLQILGAIHHTHAACTELLHDPVMRNCFADHHTPYLPEPLQCSPVSLRMLAPLLCASASLSSEANLVSWPVRPASLRCGQSAIALRTKVLSPPQLPQPMLEL